MNNETQKQMLAELDELIKIESLLSPAKANAPFGGNMRKTLDWFIDKAKSYGLKAYEKNGYYGVAEIGEGEKCFAFAAHLDVVEAGNGWSVPPFSLTQKNGYLYGRGVVDNKGPAVVMLHVLKAIADSGVTLNHRIRLIAGCNEESGSLCLKKYAEADEIPAFTLVPDADFPVIYSEKGIMFVQLTRKVCDAFAKRVSALSFGGANLNMIPNTAQAVADGKKIVTQGVAGHAMAPEKADNAAWKLFNKLKDIAPIAKDAYKLFCRADAKDVLGIDYADEKSGTLTMSLDKGEYDGKILTLTFDIRLPLCADKDAIVAKMEKAFKAKAAILAYKENLFIDPKSKLVAALTDIYQKQTGDKKSVPKKIGGGTYARELPNAIAFGATFPKTETFIHNADERISEEHFYKWFDIYYAAAAELDKLDSKNI